MVGAERSEGLLEYPRTITLGHFWTGLMTGRFEPLSDDKKADLDFEYLKHKPLTSPNQQEVADIKWAVRDAVDYVNSEKFRALAEDQLTYIDPAKIAEAFNFSDRQKFREWLQYPHLINVSRINEDNRQVFEEFIEKAGIKPLSSENKVRLLSNVENWHSLRFKDGSTDIPLTHQEIGSLDKYSMFADESKEEVHRIIETKENFRSLTARVRQRVGRDKLAVLDVGGGSGRALRDMKAIDSDIETFNLTMHEQPVMYPVDHVILCPAERMPADFEERMDIIISNMAFTQVSLPHLAMRNVIKSLSVGGEAMIMNVGIDKVPKRFEQEDAEGLVLNAAQQIKELGNMGLIDVKFTGLHDRHGLDFHWVNMNVVKKKSVKGIL